MVGRSNNKLGLVGKSADPFLSELWRILRFAKENSVALGLREKPLAGSWFLVAGSWYFRQPPVTSNQLPEARASVPQTDTGGPVEYTKASGRTMVEELGKLTP